MRAAWYDRGGPAADVLVVGRLGDPVPGHGEVRIRVHAAGVNPGETGEVRSDPDQRISGTNHEAPKEA